MGVRKDTIKGSIQEVQHFKEVIQKSIEKNQKKIQEISRN